MSHAAIVARELLISGLRQAAIERGVVIEGRLMVSDRAHFVLPYHKLLDAESARSRQIGTTSRGIGPAYEDKYGRRGVRVQVEVHAAAERPCSGALGQWRSK